MKRLLLYFVFCILGGIVSSFAQTDTIVNRDSTLVQTPHKAINSQKIINVDDALKQAEQAYASSDFISAAKLYEMLLSQNGESAVVYYNLGNAYYRQNNIARSILNYERALLLDPGDRAIRFNLQMANSHIVDTIEPVDVFFLFRWFEGLRNLQSSSGWAFWAIFMFILFLAGIAVFLFIKSVRMRKIGFYLGIVTFCLSFVFNVFALKQRNRLVNRNYGIIMTPTLNVKSSPDAESQDLFILHEGTKVKITNTLSDWNEIEIANGSIGWIKMDQLEII